MFFAHWNPLHPVFALGDTGLDTDFCVAGLVSFITGLIALAVRFKLAHCRVVFSWISIVLGAVFATLACEDGALPVGFLGAIPLALGIVSLLQCRHPATGPRKLRPLFIAVPVVVLALYFGGYPLAASRSFPTETRETSPSGAVTITGLDFGNRGREKIASAVWWRGGLFVRHVIYNNGLTFVFTTSGRVLGLQGTENDGPYYCEESFWWTGDPRSFPFPKRWYGAS